MNLDARYKMNEETKIEAIFRAVESVTGVSKENIRGKSRKREYVDARIIVAGLLETRAGITKAEEICKHINRNRVMQYYYKQCYYDLMGTDKEFTEKCRKIVDKLEK